MKLKGTTKLVAQMNSFLRPFNVKSLLGEDFAYYPTTEEIQFTIAMNERSDKVFTKFVMETFHYQIKDIFLLSLLHEVGHHLTLEDFEDYELCEEWANKIMIELEINDTNYDEKQIEYFNLPSEYAATAWAVSYLREHEKEVYRRWRVMLEHFRHFYKVNAVS